MEQKPVSYTDEELVSLYTKKHNRRALGTLFQRYSHLVLGLCLDYLKNREDARDAVMDIFEKVARKLPDHPVDQFRPWLFFVSRNHCIDILRKQLKKASAEFSEGLFVESAGADRPIDKEERRIELLSEALSSLKPHQRDCITLFYLKGHSYDQVAQQTGYSEKEVKSYLQNGRRNLQNILTRLEHERAK
ncbi:RNA polymerase sigma factor [Flavilitoribacter nigricans]|uniref:RNA polymerase subunit sigma-24 n=1 Tax=Flavilitoribacter nigricans (strain ATCC 23147 / DSM 23189 / NBRC 102662 / NCIMB 1420 / SS-2) TaxID=1122177 RepID=A0A2D0N5E8_FLAN2|nr:sigma-70 family RNA polymerase sigma factor [Flavilitoribacter nigricans]PHN03725.1 RNA polymerase subunit sigma-24 [Flavilitoribacter nigricans DSM 23189 = NBRC 102662]